MKLIIEIDLNNPVLKENQINQILWALQKIEEKIDTYNTLKAGYYGGTANNKGVTIATWRVE